MAKESRMTGPKKAAMALLSMGEEASAAILRKLSTEEIKELSVHMSNLEGGVKKETSDELLKEFASLFNIEGGVNIDGNQFIRSLLPSVLKGDKANEIFLRLDEEKQRTPFKHLKDVDPKMLAAFIKGEHPQTISIIITHLEHEKASQVLGYLPEQLQFEIVSRIACLEAVPPDLIMEVDEVLEKELTSMGSRGQTIGGVSVVAEILNRADRRTGDSILQFLDESDSDLAEKVRKLMFVFEDLMHVNDGGIRELLKEVRNEELTVALKTASEDLRSKIFKNLSQRAAQMLQEDMAMMGPARLSEVESAQQAILVVARRLEKEGKLILAGKDGGEQFV